MASQAGRPNESAKAQNMLTLFTCLRLNGMYEPDENGADKTISVETIAQQTGFSPKEVCSLAMSLATCGQDCFTLLPIDVDGSGTTISCGPYNANLSPLRLSIAERHAVLQALAVAGITPDDDLFQTLNATVMPNPAPDDEPSRTLLETTGNMDTQAFKLIANALVLHQVLRFSYHKPGGSPVTKREVEPLSLSLERGRLCLNAYSREREAVRCFVLDRMDNLENTGEVFTPRNVDVVSFTQKLKDGFTPATIRFDAGTPVNQPEWPGMTLEALDVDGGRLGHLAWTGGNWLPLHIASKGGDVRVVEPVELRQQVAFVAGQRRRAALDTLSRWDAQQ